MIIKYKKYAICMTKVVDFFGIIYYNIMCKYACNANV